VRPPIERLDDARKLRVTRSESVLHSKGPGDRWSPRAIATAEGGRTTWARVPNPSRLDTIRVSFVTPSNGAFADFAARVSTTSNGGRSWQQVRNAGPGVGDDHR
jgi:photosystem II stability/assembly factor-like uncharacterized protein